MKKYIAAILLIVPLFAFAHTDGTAHHSDIDVPLLREIGGQLNTTITSQTVDTTLIQKLQDRQKQLIELAKQSPAIALKYVVPASTRSKQSIEAQKYIEQASSLSGTLEVLHVDDFDTPENSYFSYVVNNGGVKTNIYTVKEISSRSGTRVSLQGYRLNATEFLTDGNSVSLSAMPDVGAIGKQRTLVLLVNSLAQPEQPLTPKQAEDYINNGQFQKFIKEASYGQAEFEAKAYGWIRMSDTERREKACNFSSLGSSEVKNFLSQSGIKLSDFDRVLFLSPGIGGCSFVGKIEITPGQRVSIAWVGLNEYQEPSGWGPQPFSWSNLDFVLAHELGHSLGLKHANGFDCGTSALTGECDKLEYGNNYDAMGSGGDYSLHYNGYYKEILGWIKQPNIVQISKNGTYTIQNLEIKSPQAFAKIYNPAISTSKPLYSLESRSRYGFDLASRDNGSGLLLNRVDGLETQIVDTHPTSDVFYKDQLDAGLRQGQSITDRGLGVTIGPVVRQSATSTTFGINLFAPECVRGMGVTYNGLSALYTGGPNIFSFHVRNFDSASCASSAFTIDAKANFSGFVIKNRDPLTLKAQDSGSISIEALVPDTIVLQNDDNEEPCIQYTIMNKASGQKWVRTICLGKVVAAVLIKSITPEIIYPGDTITITMENYTGKTEGIDVSIKCLGENCSEEIHLNLKATTAGSVSVEVPRSLKQGLHQIELELPGGFLLRKEINLSQKEPVSTATSTIQNVQVITNATPALAYKYERYPITWEGANLSKVNIDLYDFKGLYKIKTIDEDYDVPFSKEKQTFTYNWYVSGSALKDDIYTIKITDALNKKVKNTSPKITIQNYQAPAVGTAQSVGSTTARVATVSGGREIGFVGNFEIKINAVADTINLPVSYGFYAEAVRVSPQDKPGEYSTKSVAAKIDSMTGDATLTKDVKGNDAYKILKGKSATFKISTTFKPEEMFAGQYNIVLNYINAQNSQGKEGVVTFAPPKTPAVTIIGEKAPYITSVNNPIKANLPAIIEGVRFSPTENILITSDGQQYKLKGAVNNKITFIPSQTGLVPGEYSFQIDSPYGKSNWEWLDIKEPTNAANIFTAVWDLISGWFKSKPKQITPTVETVTSPNTDVSRITVMSPNGGEKIPFAEIYMAGDLGFKWKSETGPTASFYAAIIDENGVLVRDTNRNSLSSLGGGLYASSFIGQSKIELNKKYKIKVCDTISGYEVCDTSDGYFIVE